MILDTHAWIWFLLDDPRLPDSVKIQIDEDPSSFYISSITVWETCLLIEHGRLEVEQESATSAVRNMLKQSPIRVAPLNEEIALISRELKFKHKDPADRFIAATAHVYQLALVTADKNLKKLNWLKVVKI